MKKLKTFDSSYFIGKYNFEEDGTQNHLVFQSVYKYFEQIADNYIFIYKRMAITFINGNLKNCLMKKLILIQRLIIVSFHSQIITVLKRE